MAPSETTLPFVLRHRKLSIIPGYAITINKSQGQTFDHFGINLESAVFSHGQFYVALSRSRNSNKAKVRIEFNPQRGRLLNNNKQFTKNVVYNEIFTMYYSNKN